MKKSVLLPLSVLLLLTLNTGAAFGFDAVGSAFGTLTTAKAMGQGKGDFGFGVGIADATSFVGSFSYGLSEYTDGRIKLGIVDADGSDTKLTIGADFKWQFWNVGPQSTNPFDMAVGGFFEYVDYDILSVVQIGGQVIGSYPVALKNGGSIEPYGRFNVRLEALSLDLPANSRLDDSESNLEVGLAGGVKWSATETVGLFGEFQIDGNDGVFFGISLNVL